MHTRRSFVCLMSLGGFGVLVPLIGCDNSKTTGTQVQLSEEVKSEMNDLKSAQKEIMAERKAASKHGKKK